MIPLAMLFGHVAPPPVHSGAAARTIELLRANDPTENECEECEPKPPRSKSRHRGAIENQNRVLAYLREHGAAKRTTLCACLGLTEDQARHALEHMKSAGLVTLDGGGSRFVWRLTANGRVGVES